MNKIRRIDLVVIPRRGKARTYAFNALTIGPEQWDYMSAMIGIFEKRARRYSVPVKKIKCRAGT
ncbi:MAG TPA: hypothetical protein VG167_14965 [Verrucomicrobiae bacterium]|nr:hypothetical protein [Verrucomicrobiae bacterium]